MKKASFVILLFLYSVVCFSQDATAPSISYKPAAKALTAEVNFNPFSSTPVSINYLRLRKFVSEQNAVRLGFSLGVRNQTPFENTSQSSFDINLRPGYEHHFAGTERLSPYIGFDVDIAIKSSSYSDDRTSAQNPGPGPYSKISGAWDTNGTERGFTRFGANFLIGVDYYIIKRLYLGVEFGYGFQLINSSDITVTPRSVSSTATPIKGGSTFQIGPNYNSAIRLGFVF
jgi:hypothetical protein